MDIGMPKPPRHLLATHGAFVSWISAAYAGIVAETTLGAVRIPEGVNLTWSKKGKAPSLVMAAGNSNLAGLGVWHHADDDAEVAAASLTAARNMLRIQARNWKTDDIIDAICPIILRRTIVHHRFGLDRIVEAWNDKRPWNDQDIEISYRLRGRSAGLLAARPGDTLPGMRISGQKRRGISEMLDVVVEIADGVDYRYDHGNHTMSIKGDMPMTMLTGLQGQRLEDVVRHPMLDGCGHIIRGAKGGSRGAVLTLSPSFDTLGGR